MDHLRQTVQLSAQNNHRILQKSQVFRVTYRTSYDDLKRVSGEICPTFREACHSHRLLENNNRYSLALQEAAMSEMPSQVRALYATMLTACEPSDPLAHWGTHRVNMTEDFLHYRLTLSESHLRFTDGMYKQAPNDIQDKVLRMGGQELSTYGLPVPAQDAGERLTHEYRRETNYSCWRTGHHFIQQPRMHDTWLAHSL